MPGIFSKPKTLAILAPPAIAKETDAEVRAAARRERELLKKRRGLLSTIKTGGMGLGDEPLLSKPMLKGAMGE